MFPRNRTNEEYKTPAETAIRFAALVLIETAVDVRRCHMSET